MIKAWKTEDSDRKRLTLGEEEELLRRAAEGDELAMERMLRQYEPLALRAARQPHLAGIREDAEGEALLSLVEAIRSFDPARGVPFAGYARRKVLGDVRTFFRKERARWEQEFVPFEGDDGEDFWESVPDESDGIRSYENRELLRQAMQGLTAEERAFLRRAMNADRSQYKLAKKLGISPQAVAKRKKKLLAKLRRSMEIE